MKEYELVVLHNLIVCILAGFTVWVTKSLWSILILGGLKSYKTTICPKCGAALEDK
jgi:hypothetical protein